MIKCILIEAGHGKRGLLKDPGACSAGYTERQFTVDLARKIIDILKSKEELKGVLIQGVGVETEATINKKIFYANKVIKENRFSPNEVMYIALHINSASKVAEGYEVYYKSDLRSLELAHQLIKSNDAYDLFPNRGVKSSKGQRAGYIDYVYSSAVLIENGFINNPREREILIEEMPRVAEMNAHGILTWIRNVK
jgi:N-acetylmuramoyl-L-alanine amidase